ncbi:YigZ family protein [Anaerovibrio sp.]|uniref:YigZ family protein n=1 Tax=Anaerovibrio sp. TaxID=1872532 RepID=UPI003F13DFB2
MQVYKTTSENGTAAYEIQKSKFYAYTAHVETEAQAREFVAGIKKKHFDARHNCSAWILGADGSQQKSNDDGEPGGTAGNPILEAIKQHGLTNVAVVVTRYFGGIKLGAGGLIRAYNHTASLGLEATPQVEIKPFCPVAAEIEYPLLGTVENWIRTNGIRTRETDYLDKVTVNLLIEPRDVEKITEALTDITAARCRITAAEPEYLALPVRRSE